MDWTCPYCMAVNDVQLGTIAKQMWKMGVKEMACGEGSLWDREFAAFATKVEVRTGKSCCCWMGEPSHASAFCVLWLSLTSNTMNSWVSGVLAWAEQAIGLWPFGASCRWWHHLRAMTRGGSRLLRKSPFSTDQRHCSVWWDFSFPLSFSFPPPPQLDD